ncbi:MAG: alpha/beta hydrolase [Stagnimonas sp.]|nr:alpha/beta hydrolase [Stagnimonas sp.]
MSLGQGAPVLMLHGLANGNMATWFSGYASPLSAQRQVLLYDQRGHGGSTLPKRGFDLDSQADDLVAVLDHYGLGQRPVDVVGHSMGALVALHHALRTPSKVRRLVLVDAPMPAREFVAPSLLGAGSPEVLSDYIDSHLAAVAGLGGRRKERLRQRLTALFFETSLVQDVLRMDAEPEAALQALQVPTLLVYGRHSPCVAAGRQLARLLPNAQLVLLDCGHYIPEEAPAALRTQLERFLEVPQVVAPQLAEAA